jgi:hypothetical protein
MDSKKAHFPGRREEFGIPMRSVWLVNMCLNETYSTSLIGKYLSHTFTTQNGLKQGDALLFNLASEHGNEILGYIKGVEFLD